MINQGIKESALKNAMTSPSLQVTSESKTSLDIPLSLVVGQETIKSALILLAVNPNIGGIAIAGGKGVGKSIMARAMHRVMPPIEVVKGSEYNVAPDAREEQMDDFLVKRLRAEGKTVKDLDTEVVTCPFVQVPVNVMEDRLFGSVDVKRTLELGAYFLHFVLLASIHLLYTPFGVHLGETVFTPGLLASAHRGMLYVDDINLLDADLTTMLLQAITDGFVLVEREGISVRYPCKPVMVATFNPEDSELKDVFLDRIGIALNADTEPLTMEERIKAVEQVATLCSDYTVHDSTLRCTGDRLLRGLASTRRAGRGVLEGGQPQVGHRVREGVPQDHQGTRLLGRLSLAESSVVNRGCRYRRSS